MSFDPANPLQTLQRAPEGLYLDDDLWYAAMVGHLFVDSKRGTLPTMTLPERFLWESLANGVYDWHEDDGQWDSSYRAMRHASVMAMVLWILADQEKSRVFPPVQQMV